MYQPGKLGNAIGVTTAGMIEHNLPELFHIIKKVEGKDDYTLDVHAGAETLKQFTEEVLSTPEIIRHGLIAGEGEVIILDHKSDKESVWFVLPYNLAEEVKPDSVLAENIKLVVFSTTRDALKTYPSNVSITAYD